MRKLILILLTFLAFNTNAQEKMMQATKVETSIDPKFKVVQQYIIEARKQVKVILAQEALQNDVKNKELINSLFLDLQAVMKTYRPKFMSSEETIVQVDSLITIQEKEQLTAEILRLKSEIVQGEDSTLIQPKINELQNRKNEINKIIKNWKVFNSTTQP